MALCRLCVAGIWRAGASPEPRSPCGGSHSRRHGDVGGEEGSDEAAGGAARPEMLEIKLHDPPQARAAARSPHWAALRGIPGVLDGGNLV